MHYVHVNKHLAPPTFHLYKDTQIYFSVPVSGGSRNLKEHFCYISPSLFTQNVPYLSPSFSLFPATLALAS